MGSAGAIPGLVRKERGGGGAWDHLSEGGERGGPGPPSWPTPCLVGSGVPSREEGRPPPPTTPSHTPWEGGPGPPPYLFI